MTSTKVLSCSACHWFTKTKLKRVFIYLETLKLMQWREYYFLSKIFRKSYMNLNNVSQGSQILFLKNVILEKQNFLILTKLNLSIYFIFLALMRLHALRTRVECIQVKVKCPDCPAWEEIGQLQSPIWEEGDLSLSTQLHCEDPERASLTPDPFIYPLALCPARSLRIPVPVRTWSWALSQRRKGKQLSAQWRQLSGGGIRAKRGLGLGEA